MRIQNYNWGPIIHYLMWRPEWRTKGQTHASSVFLDHHSALTNSWYGDSIVLSCPLLSLFSKVSHNVEVSILYVVSYISSAVDDMKWQMAISITSDLLVLNSLCHTVHAVVQCWHRTWYLTTLKCPSLIETKCDSALLGRPSTLNSAYEWRLLFKSRSIYYLENSLRRC